MKNAGGLILALSALSFLGLSPAAADDNGGTCANCHTQPKKKDDDAALKAWLAAQNGQVQPEEPFSQTFNFAARRQSTPCIYNCHAPNPPSKTDYSMKALKPLSSPFFTNADESAIRAYLGYPSGPGNPATAAVDNPDAKPAKTGTTSTGCPSTKPATQPAKPAPKKTQPKAKPKRRVKRPAHRVKPAPKTVPLPRPRPSTETKAADAPRTTPAPDAKPAPQPDQTAPVTDARSQLEATANDGKGRTHFDGAGHDAPLVGDLTVDARGLPPEKSSPIGQVYLKPHTVSPDTAAPPKPDAGKKVDTDPKGARDWYNAKAYGMIGLGVGMVAGSAFGLPGILVGAVVGAALGGLFGRFF